MTAALDFLRHILPDDGYKCATVFQSNGPTYNKFFASTVDLAAFISNQDALGNVAYHACASFKTIENRKQTNVLEIQALWLDIDAGEGKPYADVDAAFHAFNAFRKQTRLPPAVLVGSGYGLHAYWPLVEALDPTNWKQLANRLRLLCQRENFFADAHRTGDSSSILRTPGTHNRKHGEQLVVQSWKLEGPYELEDLGELNVGPGLPALRNQPLAALPGGRNGRSLHSAAINVFGEEHVDIDAIAGACRQVAQLRDTFGKLPEPHWYAALGVLAHADGDAEAHQWSAGHPNYSYRETQERLERQRKLGPTTCAKFQSVNPGGCAGCPHLGRVTSPIQLGRSVALDRLGPRETILEPLEKVNGFPYAPKDFFLTHQGLTFAQESNNGQTTHELISSAPIYLDCVQTGEITNEAFSLCFKLHLPKEETRSIVLPARTFFSSQGMSEIAGRGAVIHEPDLFKKYVRDAMDLWHRENKLEKRYDQFGWKDDEHAFLYGTSLYTSSTINVISGSDEIKTRSQYLGPNRTGSLERWSSAANALFTKGCEPQSFALLSSFAAPLMRFHSAGEGGAIVSLVSDQSGSGKTTALEAVASVWGRLKGTQLTDDDTKVSKGLTLGVLGNLPCVYDELYNRDPEMIRQFVLMFTNGRDKMRGTQDGTLRHSKAEWQTILVLASNHSLVDVLSSMDGTDAPAFRILEFVSELPAGLSTRGDELKRELAANSGFAGDVFLRTLLQPETLAYVRKALPLWTDSIWKRTGLRNEHRFWVRTLASVVAAGVIVRHCGILDFSVQRILDWAVDELQIRSGEATVTGVRTAVSVLAEFLHSNINSMLVLSHAWRPQTQARPLLSPRQELLIRYEQDSGKTWILENALRKYLVKKGVNRHMFMKDLKERGVITNEHKRITLGAGTDFASGQVTAIEVFLKHPAMSGIVINVDEIIKNPSANNVVA